MKKYVMAMLVVLMVAGIANAAAILDIYVAQGGPPGYGGPTEVTLVQSETAVVQTWVTMTGASVWGADVIVYSATNEGADWTLTDYDPEYVADYGFPLYGNIYDFAGGPVAGLNGYRSQDMDYYGAGYVGPFLLHEMVIHCTGEISDSIIGFNVADPGMNIVDNLTGTIFTVANGGLTFSTDHVVIHQVPEPASLALLALGGLALIRRRH
jgi:hypothetical protein